MNVRPFLRSPENRNHAALDRVVGQNVDGQIETHPRRVPADRGRAHHHGGKIARPVSGQCRFAKPLILAVIRQRDQGMFLGHLGGFTHAIHRAR